MEPFTLWVNASDEKILTSLPLNSTEPLPAGSAWLMHSPNMVTGNASILPTADFSFRFVIYFTVKEAVPPFAIDRSAAPWAFSPHPPSLWFMTSG